jgi:integrase/recombinase XerD
MSGKKRPFHFKNNLPADPAVRRFGDWSHENRDFHQAFRNWLKETGYGEAAINLYSVASRQAIGFIDKPYWIIDPEADIESAWQHLCARPISSNTLADYHKGLRKLADYLRLRCHQPPKAKPIRWEYFTGSLPEWLQADIRDYLHHCQRNWKPEHQIERFKDLLRQVTLPLRWMAAQFPLNEIGDLTPQAWFAYVDARLEAGILPSTLNGELSHLKHLVHYLREHERPVCERFLLVNYLDEGKNLPKDVPIDQLRLLQQAIQSQAAVSHAGRRRLGRMDLAWFLLMLHSGLRTCEVRCLRLGDIDWEGRKLRIEQSKGMKDRIVYLSQATIEALQAYLEVRGAKEALPEFVFIYSHRPLSRTYCFERLNTYCRPLGFHVTPHQLRHSCATLLLNSGAPVLTVQVILGHKWVDTTLGYARLYDGTVAADYYGAMAGIEQRLALPEDRLSAPPALGQLIALVDSLRTGALNAAQTEAVRQLRIGIEALAAIENDAQVVNVPSCEENSLIEESSLTKNAI